jgi:hypothetical protein
MKQLKNIHMKKTFYLLSVILLGILVTTWYSCEAVPEETCEQDEICENKFVTACCTENECVYKYNGKEYTEDQIDQLAEDLGCGTSAVVLKSGSQENDLSGVIGQLKTLMGRVQKRIKAGK